MKNVNEVADIEAVVKNYSKLMIPSSLLMMSSTSVLKLALGGGSGGAPRHSVSGRKPIGGSACSGPGAHSTRIQLRIKVQVANLKTFVYGRYRSTAMSLPPLHNRPQRLSIFVVDN